MKDKRTQWLIDSIKRAARINGVSLEETFANVCSSPKSHEEFKRFKQASEELGVLRTHNPTLEEMYKYWDKIDENALRSIRDYKNNNS
jgi:predicted glycosyl hydrolase (DUF1957 family)